MNNKFFKILAISLLFFSTLSLHAFSVKRNAFYNKNIFGIEFPNDTSFYAAANLVTGVSMQRYILGGFEISEVVIEINGSTSQLRIYAMDLVGARTAKFKQAQVEAIGAMVDQYAEALEENVSKYLPDTNIVVKEYPLTTHAKTIEYKVSSTELAAFYSTFSTDYTKTSTTSSSITGDDDDDEDSSETVTKLSKTSVGGSKYTLQ